MATIKRVITADGAIRAYCVDSRDIVSQAFTYHHTTPVVTAALGRTLTMTAIMCGTFKGGNDAVTILIQGDGPVGGIVACGNSKGRIKGYVYHPDANVPKKKNGKLDVGGVIGKGTLSISRDLGLKEPYTGQVPLVTGEIAEDFTYYYAMSEQIPTAIALGVQIDVDYSVRTAGGYMLQLMPEADEKTAEELERRVRNLEPVTQLLDNGLTADDIIAKLLDGYSYENLSDVTMRYACDCSESQIERALISLGRKELEEMIETEESIELTCQFCPKVYHVTREEMKQLLKRCTRD